MELGLKNELTIEDMIEDLNIKFGLTFKIEENFRGRTIGTRLYGQHSPARVDILINRIGDYLNYGDNCWAEKLNIREIVPEIGNEYDIEISFIQGEVYMNYFEYLDKTQDIIDRLEILLMKLDIEIGSTINSNDDANVVLNNMERANQILQEIKELYNIKF